MVARLRWVIRLGRPVRSSSAPRLTNLSGQEVVTGLLRCVRQAAWRQRSSTVHIAHITTRDHQSPGTVEWANTMGVTAPLDIFTAETPAGMFWFRPRALRRLLDFKFEPKHFEPQPNEYLELILRRLVWPAAHTVGNTVKCVLTPASMATNYVKLEYKLQKMIAEPTPPRKPDFPRGEMEAFIRDRLSDRPSTLTVVETSIRAARGLFRVAKTVTNTLAPREPQ